MRFELSLNKKEQNLIKAMFWFYKFYIIDRICKGLLQSKESDLHKTIKLFRNDVELFK